MYEINTKLIAMLILGALFIPFVSAQNVSNESAVATAEKQLIEEYNFTQEDLDFYAEQGFDAVDILKVESRVRYLQSLPAVIRQAPYSPMLCADAETQEAILKHIDNFSIPDTERQEMKTQIEDIWSRFPDGITVADYPTLIKIGTVLDAYLSEAYWNEEEIGKFSEDGVSTEQNTEDFSKKTPFMSIWDTLFVVSTSGLAFRKK